VSCIYTVDFVKKLSFGLWTETCEAEQLNLLKALTSKMLAPLHLHQCWCL